MKIKVLGAHNTESRNTKNTCLLVDGILALDAGGLTSSLSFRDQVKIKALLVTHSHYDHIRDIPGYAINLFLRKKSVDVFTHQPVYDNLVRYLINGELYPEFHKEPADNPILRFHIISVYQEFEAAGYRILAAPVAHAIPALGYQVTSTEGKRVFYTGDTGGGLSYLWPHISPQVLFIEMTTSNRWEHAVQNKGHLTPHLLHQEMLQFKEIKGYLPRVFCVHYNPDLSTEIEGEVAEASRSLGTPIVLAHEGMVVEV